VSGSGGVLTQSGWPAPLENLFAVLEPPAAELVGEYFNPGSRLNGGHHG